MERVTSTSSRGLAGWGNPTLPQSGFTLYLRVHSARNLAAVGRGSYCKLYLGNTEVVNGSVQAGASFSTLLATDNSPQTQLQMQPPTHRVFRTKVLYATQKSCPEWNEKLELHVLNPVTEILTIRVKNQLMLYCPAIGGCAIPLCNVKVGEPAEQWFPLHKGGKLAGHIRLQLLLKQKDPTMRPSPPVAVNESPMQRLIHQHCQQERERRHLQQSDESRRRQQFEEQERIQAELRRQRQEAGERERTIIEKMAKMQDFHEQMQRDEQAKVQAYPQKQLKHEEGRQTAELAEKMSAIKVEEAPEVETTKSINGLGYYFADDVVKASTSRHSSSSSGLKQSISGSLDGTRREQVVEAVELTDVLLGEVVHDALPSSDSSSDGEDHKQGILYKKKERHKQHSRKQSRSVKDSKVNSHPLFPRSPQADTREEIPHGSISLAILADSSSSEETSSSEDEHRRRRRRRKEKKAKRKERRRRRKTKRRACRGSDGYEFSSSCSSSSSFSPSSSSSSDERRKRKARKHKKSKERARSQREGKASSIPHAPAPPHSNSYGPDHSNYPTNKYNDPPPAYARPAQPQQGAGSTSNFIETLPPQPRQKRTIAEKISTAADVASIFSDVASVATSIQQLAGGGDAAGGIPFAMPDMSQFLGGQDLSGLDLSGFAGDFSG